MYSGARLKEARNILKLSQEELGRPFGYAHSKIRDMESGKQKITMEVAKNFEEKFFISSKWLDTGEGEMFARVLDFNNLDAMWESFLGGGAGLTPRDITAIAGHLKAKGGLSSVSQGLGSQFKPQHQMIIEGIDDEDDGSDEGHPHGSKEDLAARESLSKLKTLPARQRANISKVMANLIEAPRELASQLARDTSIEHAPGGALGSIRPLEAFDVPISSRRIPVISWAQAGIDGFFEDSHVVGGGFTDISCPYDVTDPSAYALEISGDSMSPKYEDGDYVIVSPARGVQTGNDAIVKLRDGQIMAKRIKAKNSHFILSSLNSDFKDITCQKEDVVFMHRIVWVKPRG